MQQVWCNCNAIEIKNTVDAFLTKAPTIACILENSSFKTIKSDLARLIELNCIGINRSAQHFFLLIQVLGNHTPRLDEHCIHKKTKQNKTCI